MTITTLVWAKVKVTVPKLNKVWDWSDCMINIVNGVMTIRATVRGRTTEDSLVLGKVDLKELTSWTLKAKVKAMFDDKLYTATVEAEF